MKKIAYVADSGIDLTLQQAENEDIYVLRMPIVIESVEYREGLHIDRTRLFEHQSRLETMHTSQPTLGDVISLWDDLLTKYESVLMFPISRYISGFYDTCIMLSQQPEYLNRVIVVDSRHLSYGLQRLIGDLRKLELDGKTALELKAIVESSAHWEALLCPNNMTYLAMGGRVAKAVAGVGNLLKIIPIISFGSDGVMVADKVRTIKKAYRVAVEKLVDQFPDYEAYYWFILRGNNKDEEVELALSCMEEKIGVGKIEVKELQSIILTHTGSDAMGFCCVKKLI